MVTVRALRTATTAGQAQPDEPGRLDEVGQAGQTGRSARRGRSRTAVVAGLLAGALLLGGCAATPGTAAVVEGRTISRTMLDAAEQDLSAVIPGVTAQAILMGLVAAPYFIDAAAEHGVGVSTEQARALIESRTEGADLPETQTFGPGAVEVIRFTLAVQALRGLPDGETVLQEVDAEVRSLDIEINPRYGELDPASATIVATTLPWIAAAK